MCLPPNPHAHTHAMLDEYITYVCTLNYAQRSDTKDDRGDAKRMLIVEDITAIRGVKGVYASACETVVFNR